MTSEIDEAHVTGAAIDTAGNIYVAGYVTDPDNMPPSAPEAPHVFLAKYDGAGTPQWTRAIASSGGTEKVNAVAADGAGNLYVVGFTSGDFGGSGNLGYDDAYVLKYDGAGNQVWARQLGTGAVDTADAVTTDAAGNVYVGGGTYSSLGTCSGARSIARRSSYSVALPFAFEVFAEGGAGVAVILDHQDPRNLVSHRAVVSRLANRTASKSSTT